MLIPLAALCVLVQGTRPTVATAAASRPALTSPPIEVALQPQSPRAGAGLRWSPKGAKVPLVPRDGALHGSFTLGPAEALRVGVRLSRTSTGTQYEVLELGREHDGKLLAPQRLTTTAKEQRGKWWSSFDAELAIPVVAKGGAQPATRAYPVALWFVADPQAPEAPPELRWSRRGWHQGQVEIDGKPAFVLITDGELDGVFDQRDAWALARDPKALLAAGYRSLEKHVWLDRRAWRATRIDADGATLRFEPFDPGVTEAEDLQRSDPYLADRNVPRAPAPLAFAADLPAALAQARAGGQRVLVDFETTWCGPCQVMKQLVYTASAVVDAAKGVLPVRLDGDEQRALVQQYKVGAYPTLLLLAADGTELRRAVGYRSVRELIEFLKP